MRLGKTSIIVLVVGVFLVLGASLGLAYSDQSRKEAGFSKQLASTQSLLEKQQAKFAEEALLTQRKGLEARLTAAQQQAAKVKEDLVQNIESIEVTDTLFKIAHSCNVTVILVRESPPVNQKLKSIDFKTQSIAVDIEGGIPEIFNFVSTWSEQHPTGVVSSVIIELPGAGEEEEEGPSEEGLGEIDDEEPGTVEQEPEETEEESDLPYAQISLLIFSLGGTK